MRSVVLASKNASPPRLKIRLNTFRNARDKAPTARDLSWRDTCREIKKLIGATTRKEPADESERKRLKTDLPAFNCAILTEPYNCDANVESLTALPIDVDRGDLLAVHERAEATKIAALIYTSPSHPNPDGTDRFRVIVPLDQPLAPGDVKHARKALAELLGIGPGQGVERADAASQVFFGGKFKGSAARDFFEVRGTTISTEFLTARKLTRAWPKPIAAKKVKALDRLGIEDPDERTIALLEALEPHWEAPGEADGRRQILRALGGYLARRGWSDEQIAAVGRGLPTDRPESDRLALMIECARVTRETDGETGAGWSGLVGWNSDAAALIESVAKDPIEPKDFVGIWTKGWRAAYARPGSWVNRGRERREAAAKAAKAAAKGPGGEEFAPPSNDDDEPSVPLILRSIDGHVCLLWEGDERGHRPLAEKNLRLRIKELGFDQSLMSLRDDKGRPRTPDSLIEEYGATYERTAYAFANRVTTYDASAGGSVTIGYPRPMLAARFDADADRWLRALGGAQYDRLCVWIASCAQSAIDRLAACLVIVGKKDSGKSMLGHALAGMWGATPPPLALIVTQFNFDMTRCPILADEEAQLFGSKQLSTKKLRDEIQSPERSVERKGKERVRLVGALRMVVSCNDLSDLKFTDLGGPDVIDALQDRFLLINAKPRAEACREALAALRVTGQYIVDLERVAGHLAWICATTELPAERFLGSGGDAAEGAILAGHVDETIDVWESFRDWLAGNEVSQNPWSARAEGLALNTSALGSMLSAPGRPWDHRAVRAAAAPFHTGDVRPKLPDDSQPRLWILDAPRLAAAVGIGVKELDTLERRLEAATRPDQHRSRGRFSEG